MKYTDPHCPTNRAVAPVIGTIIMVAITVVLAMTVSGAMLSMPDGINPSPTVTLSSDIDDPETLNVTLEHGGGDPLAQDTLRITLTDADGSTAETSIDQRMTAGDTLEISSDTDGNTNQIELTVIHKPSGTILHDDTNLSAIEGSDLTVS